VEAINIGNIKAIKQKSHRKIDWPNRMETEYPHRHGSGKGGDVGFPELH
jgi:hypothetical protein